MNKKQRRHHDDFQLPDSSAWRVGRDNPHATARPQVRINACPLPPLDGWQGYRWVSGEGLIEGASEVPKEANVPAPAPVGPGWIAPQIPSEQGLRLLASLLDKAAASGYAEYRLELERQLRRVPKPPERACDLLKAAAYSVGYSEVDGAVVYVSFDYLNEGEVFQDLEALLDATGLPRDYVDLASAAALGLEGVEAAVINLNPLEPDLRAAVFKGLTGVSLEAMVQGRGTRGCRRTNPGSQARIGWDRAADVPGWRHQRSRTAFLGIGGDLGQEAGAWRDAASGV